MSTSAEEMVERHQRFAEVYAAVAQKYPGATVQRIGGVDVVLTMGGAREDRIMVIEGYLVAYERVEAAGSWLPVVANIWGQEPTVLALEHLREAYPDAYMGLIEWMKR